MNAKIIGEHIKKFRKEKGLTQQQLADSLFVSDKTISRWELGKGLPDIEELPRIAAMLNISIDRLVGNDTGENAGKLIFSVNSKGKSYLQMDIFLNRPYTFNFENKYTLSVNGEQIPVGRVKGLATDDSDTEACFFEPISLRPT